MTEKITMTTNTKQVDFPNKERTYGIAVQAGHFLRHLLEMCMSMCVGMAVLGVLYLWAAWMRYRGMKWRPTVERSAAMFIEAILLIGVAWLGIIPERSVEYD